MMFTGIIEETGFVNRLWRAGKGYNLAIRAETTLIDTRLGDSIAVNGTCLTVAHLDSESFTMGLAPETLARTNLEYLRPGHAVNLERALTPSSRMGGHFVQGHIDGLGTITGFRPEADALSVTIKTEPELMRYIVPKGFIALDGVSLTLVDVFEDSFTVMLVAYTQLHISLAQKGIGSRINIEVDILGKYIEKIITHPKEKSEGISLEFLTRHGYQGPLAGPDR